MSGRHEFSTNGLITFENIQEQIENNDFWRVSIGAIGGIDDWFFQFELRTKNNQQLKSPSVVCPGEHKHQLQSFFQIIKKDGSSAFTFHNQTILDSNETDIYVQKLLDPKNEYLNDDGGLSIEYGIQVISTLGEDGMWRFNFYDRIFNCQEEGNMISFIKENGEELKFLHCHKQLLALHSKFFDSKSDENQIIKIPSDINYEALEQCLQIAHGVRAQISDCNIYGIIKAARVHSLPNVISYCERKLIEKDLGIESIKNAIVFKLNRPLAKLMKKVKSSEELEKILEDAHIQNMSGEAMKQCAKFFFESSDKLFISEI